MGTYLEKCCEGKAKRKSSKGRISENGHEWERMEMERREVKL